MYHCLSSFNSPPRYAFSMHNFGFTSFCKLPSYAISRISISNARTVTIICPAAVPFASDESMTDHPAAIDDESQDFSFNFRGQRTDSKLVKEDDLLKSQGPGSKLEESHYLGTAEVVNNRGQMVRRSSVMAKQVISIRSALSLGFISQLWVDASSWVVSVVEVRPNLLSSNIERFLLKEITQVGDVVLVEDENVILDDLKLVGLETIVGYTVITPNGQQIGKVRDLSFNIKCGAVESLELDAFGMSIIPSSLVSTYALYVEDVMEVVSDTVMVRAAALSHIQRLTKGLWNGQKAGNLNDESREELDDNEEQDRRHRQELDDNEEQDRRHRRLSRQKFRSRTKRSGDEWELPMDYL